MVRSWRASLVLAAAVALFFGGCGDDSGSDSASTTAVSASTLTGTVTVSAATSLTAAFTELATGFEDTHPDVDVVLNVDASSALAAQILEGAPADVYASADEANMAKLTAADLIAGEPATFAHNELVIATKPGNPAGIATLADLADAGVISLCGAEVPCGRYAEEALEKAGVTIPESQVTRGQNVGATLTAVAAGDAVAGIVYVTDARSAEGRVDAVSIPTEENVIATYPIGALESSGNAEAAEAFQAYVLSGEGRAVLARFGFIAPS